MQIWEALREMILPTKGESDYKVSYVAARLGVATSTVYQWCENRREPKPSQLQAISAACESTLLIEALCRLHGGTFCPTVQATARDIETGGLAETIHEASEVFSRVSLAVKDGEVTKDELAACSREIDEAMQAFETLRAALRAANRAGFENNVVRMSM